MRKNKPNENGGEKKEASEKEGATKRGKKNVLTMRRDKKPY